MNFSNTRQKDDRLQFDDEFPEQPGIASVEQLHVLDGVVVDVQGHVSPHLAGEVLQDGQLVETLLGLPRVAAPEEG